MLNVGEMIYQVIVFGLPILFVLSFTLFIRKLLMNQQANKHQLNQLEMKIDKIIDLMESTKK